MNKRTSTRARTHARAHTHTQSRKCMRVLLSQRLRGRRMEKDNIDSLARGMQTLRKVVSTSANPIICPIERQADSAGSSTGCITQTIGIFITVKRPSSAPFCYKYEEQAGYDSFCMAVQSFLTASSAVDPVINSPIESNH